MKSLFESAQYASILKTNVISSYRVGALIFTGRYEEAKILADKEEWNSEEKEQIQFYLLLASVRASNYLEMKKELLVLYKLTKMSNNRTSKFYILQGIALIRFYKGEFLKAQQVAHNAFKEAFLCNDNYLCMLANDLLAHSYCMICQYGRGLALFDESLRFAKKIMNNSNISIIKLSKTIYKIDAGWDLDEEVDSLEKWIRTTKQYDNYSLNDALIVKAKYLQLKGKFHQAELLLLEISQSIYSYNFNRQILSYNLTLARLKFLMDGPSSSLGIIGTSLKLCSKGEDYYYLQRFYELKNYIENTEEPSMKEKLLYLKSKTGRPTINKFPISTSLEKILIEHFDINKLTLNNIIDLEKRNLLGIILFINKYPSKNFIDLRFGQRSALISQKGDITLIQGLTSRQFELLSIIIQRPRWLRNELFEAYWGIPFDDLLHSNKYYVTLKRLKKALKLKEEIFCFERGEVIVQRLHVYNREIKVGHKESPLKTSQNLNPRQLLFLNNMKKNSMFTPKDYAKFFQISRNTVSRDLFNLCKQGLIIRKGDKRGTYYIII